MSAAFTKDENILLKYVITYFISTLQVQNLQGPAKIGIFTCTMYICTCML